MKATRPDLERNRSQSIEALRFTLLICQLAHFDLVSTVRSIEKGSEKPSMDESLHILSFCWQIVDTVHRAGELCRHIRGLKNSNATVKYFLRVAEDAKKFRNSYQHIATDLPTRPQNSQPSMGSIGWVTKFDPLKSVVIGVGGGYPGYSVIGLTFDNVNKQFSQDLLLSSGNLELRLDHIHSAVASFVDYFEEWLSANNLLCDSDIKTSKLNFNVELKYLETR